MLLVTIVRQEEASVETFTKTQVFFSTKVSILVTWMLSLGKPRVGAEAYYLGQIARGLDDYYIGGSETQGRWIGTGAGLLDLADDVTSDDLRAVLAGLAPGTGLSPKKRRHTRSHARDISSCQLAPARAPRPSLRRWSSRISNVEAYSRLVKCSKARSTKSATRRSRRARIASKVARPRSVPAARGARLRFGCRLHSSRPKRTGAEAPILRGGTPSNPSGPRSDLTPLPCTAASRSASPSTSPPISTSAWPGRCTPA